MARLRPGGIRREPRARHPREPGAIRRVDHRLGLHRLAPRAVGHHDAGDAARPVAQHVGGAAAVEEGHPRIEQCLIERLLHPHRGGHCQARGLLLLALGSHHHDLAEQHPPGRRPLAEEASHVPRAGRDGRGELERRLHVAALAELVVLDHRHLPPRLAVVADRHRDVSDLEVPRALEEHEADPAQAARLAEVEGHGRVGIVLHALSERVVPLAVGEHRRRLGVHVLLHRRLVGLVGEAQPPLRHRVGEHRLGERRRRHLARLEPQAVGRTQVLAQVGTRRGNEHLGARPRGRHGGGDASARAAHHHHVNVVGHSCTSAANAPPRHSSGRQPHNATVRCLSDIAASPRAGRTRTPDELPLPCDTGRRACCSRTVPLLLQDRAGREPKSTAVPAARQSASRTNLDPG